MTDVERVLEHAKTKLKECDDAISEAATMRAHVLAWVQEASVWIEFITWLEEEFGVE